MKEWLILIVDENEDDRQSLADCFSSDYKAVAASSGREALNYLAANEVDVILGNLNIGDMTGLDLFR